jgi:hypothetical protein
MLAAYPESSNPSEFAANVLGKERQQNVQQPFPTGCHAHGIAETPCRIILFGVLCVPEDGPAGGNVRRDATRDVVPWQFCRFSIRNWHFSMKIAGKITLLAF